MIEPRSITIKELDELAVAAAESCMKEPLDGPDCEEVEDQRGCLLNSAVAAFDHYTTDSPGYQGTVYVVVWPGGPELHSTYIKDGSLIKSTDEEPVVDVDALEKRKTWIVRYCHVPTNYHTPHNAIVDAVDAEEAAKLVRRELGDGNGVNNYVLDNIHEYEPQPLDGRIISMGDKKEERE